MNEMSVTSIFHTRAHLQRQTYEKRRDPWNLSTRDLFLRRPGTKVLLERERNERKVRSARQATYHEDVKDTKPIIREYLDIRTSAIRYT